MAEQPAVLDDDGDIYVRFEGELERLGLVRIDSDEELKAILDKEASRQKIRENTDRLVLKTTVERWPRKRR